MFFLLTLMYKHIRCQQWSTFFFLNLQKKKNKTKFGVTNLGTKFFYFFFLQSGSNDKKL